MLPLRDVVVMPHTPISLIVGRARSLNAVAAARRKPGNEIFLSCQLDGDQANPSAEEIQLVGTLGKIQQVLVLPDGNSKILVEGTRRARITRGTVTRGSIETGS